MSIQVNLGRGSKQNVRRVRWKYSEIISLLLLLVMMAIAAVAAAVWINIHGADSIFDDPNTPASNLAKLSVPG